jgi:hypothetical protein
MALLPVSRSIFENVDLRTLRRVIGGKPVRLKSLENGLLICARSGEELVLVEPHIRPGGRLELTYSLRDPALLAEALDLLRKPSEEQR